jgi:hypothetical protein
MSTTLERSVTIKFQGKDAPWLVYRGTAEEIKSALVADFDLDNAEGVALAGIVNNAQRQAEALSAAKGTVIAAVDLGSRQPLNMSDEAQAGTDPWAEAAQVAEAPAPDPLAPLYTAIEGAADRAALKVLYAENQAAFGDADLLAAWKAKGKSLPA